MNKEDIRKLISESIIKRNINATTAYRNILATIDEREIRENKQFSESDIISIIKKEIKTLDESIETFKGRSEENNFIDQKNMLEQLLPKQLDESKYEEIIYSHIKNVEATTIRDMGKVIKSIREEHGNIMDMGKVSFMVKGILV